MPQTKKPTQQTSAKSKQKKTVTPKRTAVKPVAKKTPAYSPEYAEYLERYELYGEGRPRLKPSEFDRFDDELLDLLAQEMERGLDDEQTIRLKELEFLLLDSES